MSLAKPSHGRNLRSGLLLTFWLLAGFGLQTGAQAESRVEPVTESDALEYRVEAMAENLGVVWGMTWVAPDRLLFTQRQGEAGVLAIDSGEVTPLHGLPLVYDLGQGGLLDVQRAPDYEASGWLYFTYSKPQGNGAVTTLARARLQGDRLVAWQDLLVTRSASSRTIHFGSRIAFDDQGHVFFSVGDRGERDRAQDLSNHAGTILRLNLDGSVPADNPFVGVEGALDEIWSYGHRNPQGLAYDAKQRRLWAIEHGPRGGDELNWVQKGQNYGWPIASQGKEYASNRPVGVPHRPGMVDPLKVYVPSIAPSSLLLYQGAAFPQWRGDLFAGALVLRHLNRIDLDAHALPQAEHRLLGERNQRIRSLAEDRHGHLYVGTDSGQILRVSPAEP